MPRDDDLPPPPPAGASPVLAKGDSHLAPSGSGAPLGRSPSYVPRVFHELYELGPKLGSGAYADVYEIHSRTTNVAFACKMISREGMDDFVAGAFKEEMALLRKLHHSNIVNLVDFLSDEHRFYVVLEIMRGGELLERLVQRSTFSEADARDVMRQVLDALDYCHQRDIVHRDLKPENLLLTDDSDSATLKVADFGLAFQSAQQQTTLCGTPNYIAPEVLRQEPYGKPVDVWAVGVIVYLLLCGSLPWRGRSRREKFEHIKQGAYSFDEAHSPECAAGGACVSWAHISAEARQFVAQCLALDPAARPTVQELRAHEWLQTPLGERGRTNSLHQLKAFNARTKWRTALQLVRLGGASAAAAAAAGPPPGGDDVDSEADSDDDSHHSVVVVEPPSPASLATIASGGAVGTAAAGPAADGKPKDECVVM